MSLDSNGKLTVANIIISIFIAAMIAWIFWLTSNQIELLQFAARGDRFTTADGEKMRREITDEIKGSYPPKWLVDAVNRLMTEHSAFDTRIDRLEKQ